jgi:hypothetical protein
MRKQILVALMMTSLLLAACVTDPNDPLANDDVEETAAGDQEVVVPIAIEACLLVPPCAAFVYATLGVVVYTVADFTTAQLVKAIDAAVIWYKTTTVTINCPPTSFFTPDPFRLPDLAAGCKTAQGTVACYSRRHKPCQGDHTHGTVTFNELRSSGCVLATKAAVRCDGPAAATLLPCFGPTVPCGTGGPATNGIYIQ